MRISCGISFQYCEFPVAMKLIRKVKLKTPHGIIGKIIIEEFYVIKSSMIETIIWRIFCLIASSDDFLS